MAQTRARAKQLGESFYFTGIPCKNGHTAKRKVHNYECVECAKEYKREYVKRTGDASTKKWRENNKEKVKETRKAYYHNNKDKFIASARKWKANNPDKVKKAFDKWLEENRGVFNMKSRERYRMMKEASPNWSDKDYIKDIYSNCAEWCSILKECGISTKFEVDHIVPINNKNVCGLHNEFNLQILSKTENLVKSNKLLEEYL